MHRLEVKLLDRLGRHEAHPRTPYCFRNCLGVSEVVLLAAEKGFHRLGRHQPGVMTECHELPA